MLTVSSRFQQLFLLLSSASLSALSLLQLKKYYMSQFAPLPEKKEKKKWCFVPAPVSATAILAISLKDIAEGSKKQ